MTDLLLENAQRIFEVAQSAGNSDSQDFTLLIRSDGGMHVLMESPVSFEAAAAYEDVRIAYLVTRSHAGTRVHGRSLDKTCVLENRNPAAELLRDQVLYRITSSSA